MKQQNINKVSNIKSIVFLCVGVIFTIAFIIGIIAIINNSKIHYKKNSDLENSEMTLKGSQLYNYTDEKYYVYIYSKESTLTDHIKEAELSPIILDYANFARKYKKDSNIIPLYVYSLDDSLNKTTFNEKLSGVQELPMVVLVEGRTIQTQLIKITEIQKQFETIKETVKQSMDLAVILPEKNSWSL